MTIDGNIKIFELSKALVKNGATATASSGATSQDNALDFNLLTRWQSEGSDDTTVETYLVTFGESLTISRLLLLDFNFKSYTITPVTSAYILDESGDEILDDLSDEIEDDGSILEFLNVISSTNSIAQTGISETDHSLENQYYEFDPTYCSGFLITVTEAQMFEAVPNQEKYCHICLPTIEIDSNEGTFQQYPELQETTDFVSVNSKNLSGKNKVQKLDATFEAVLSLTISGVQNDVRIMQFLRYTDVDFLVFPSGGKLPEDYFRFTSTPYNFNIYQMQAFQASLPAYINNIASNAVGGVLQLKETI